MLRSWDLEELVRGDSLGVVILWVVGCALRKGKSWVPTWLRGIALWGPQEQEENLSPRHLQKLIAATAAKSLQSCPTLCHPIDGSPPGFSVPGILQARILEWIAISFSNAWNWKVKAKLLSCVQLFTTLWTVAYQAPLSMGFSRQEYWSGLPLPSPFQT